MTSELKAIWFVPPAIQRSAESAGLLEHHGISVMGSLTRSSDQQFEALRDGTCDAAVTAMDNVIVWNQRDGGGDFRIIAQIEADTGNALLVQPGIRSIADLAGRRLLVDSAENGFVVALRALLADAGVNFEECSVIRAGGVKERLDAMRAGEGDATLLGPPFIELGEGSGLRVLARVTESYPAFPGQGLVVRQAFARDRRLLRWLAALEAGRRLCRRDPGAVASGLVAGGMPAASARTLADYVGDTLEVSRAGVKLLIAHRSRLDLPGGTSAFEDLVDAEPLARALAHPNSLLENPE